MDSDQNEFGDRLRSELMQDQHDATLARLVSTRAKIIESLTEHVQLLEKLNESTEQELARVKDELFYERARHLPQEHFGLIQQTLPPRLGIPAELVNESQSSHSISNVNQQSASPS